MRINFFINTDFYLFRDIYVYKRIDNLCTIFDDSSILLFV